MGVPEELKAKRCELAGRARELAAALAELQAQIVAVDKVISIYEPEWKPAEQPKKRRGRPPMAMSAKELDKLIGGTNKRQMTLEILRTARRPLSTAECAQEFATRHGLSGDDPQVALIGNRLSSILDALQKAGRVRHAGMLDGHSRQWEIAA
ncbi:MAG: hypothetical protein E5X80_06930 [Mesorhizobium sp.]|uniref:hypothetical protein n=1 Tax=Mesorhizobium sp. TaxID=1871066 RepID=UPI00122A1CDF|nr:hypothetical protein [Mesorhizobium sp.]TIO54648.1 MAG: hypothetical protein E5X78_03040 [Mesorhizobium sp.]TIO62583.1 MAG: hypothetical protein E5X79_02640 [Mesorhizobium sp.]TJV66206.1 MAG: hypothetical protein E5X80_06930 [Mesorhizobium sp.]